MTVNQSVYGYVVDEETYPDKATIIEEGSRGNWAYVIMEGRAKVKKRTSKGMVIIDQFSDHKTQRDNRKSVCHGRCTKIRRGLSRVISV